MEEEGPVEQTKRMLIVTVVRDWKREAARAWKLVATAEEVARVAEEEVARAWKHVEAIEVRVAVVRAAQDQQAEEEARHDAQRNT